MEMYNVFGSNIDLQQFYPEELKIKKVTCDESGIVLRAFTESRPGCCCPKCHVKSTRIHGTYDRKVQDLPILNKTTWLYVNADEYQCENPDCEVKTFAEDLDGFLSYYGRMTERLSDFLCTLALQTSCESCAKIMKSAGVKASGDTIIRMLVKKYGDQPEIKCGDTIGVDDFAFRKGREYGTVVVDEKTRRPVAVLEGRDAATLSEWLQRNKHVKVVTRDRASAYSKAISDILPDCMQIADRFHLHQNLMEAVKKILGREIPAATAVPNNTESSNAEEASTETDSGKEETVVLIPSERTDAERVDESKPTDNSGCADDDEKLSTSESQDCKKNVRKCG